MFKIKPARLKVVGTCCSLLSDMTGNYTATGVSSNVFRHKDVILFDDKESGEWFGCTACLEITGTQVIAIDEDCCGVPVGLYTAIVEKDGKVVVAENRNGGKICNGCEKCVSVELVPKLLNLLPVTIHNTAEYVEFTKIIAPMSIHNLDCTTQYDYVVLGEKFRKALLAGSVK